MCVYILYLNIQGSFIVHLLFHLLYLIPPLTSFNTQIENHVLTPLKSEKITLPQKFKFFFVSFTVQDFKFCKLCFMVDLYYLYNLFQLK